MDDITPHHVIKILHQPLNNMKSGIPPVGTRVATIALYEGIIEKGYWDDFHPQVINCITHDQVAIERVISTIPDWEWEHLAMGMDYLNKMQPGLYGIPFTHCRFCHETVFLPFYVNHLSKHIERREDGQMKDHITVCPEQRYQGLITQVPQIYIHEYCQSSTKMPEEIIRSYLANPFLYNQYTFCTGCNDYVHQSLLFWHETGQSLADYFDDLQQEYYRHIEKYSSDNNN
jgi:Protein of unknown function (DUF3239)